MTSDRREEARRIFLEVCVLTGDEQKARLHEMCAGDEQLKAEVLALLKAGRAAGGFLDSPTGDLVGDGPTGQDAGASSGVPSPDAAAAPGSFIGRYKLLEQIGEGGFGSVWAAEQREPLKRRVALKIIKLGMDTTQVIARFEAERQALAMMDHPNIAKVFDAGCTETGRPYFVMELVKGVPILDYCDNEAIDTESRLGLFANVCNAIQHAHQKGVIHRDIKPSNVLVTLHDGIPVPKVIDFGIAKAINQELTEKTIYTQHHQVIGTPAYMSPEQAEVSGLDIDTRSDIYSLGVLLYEILTGTPPFTHDELMSAGYEGMLRMIREVEPQKPSTRLSSLGKTATRTAQQRRANPRKLGVLLRGDLDWVVMKCLEKDRTRRYDSAGALAKDLARHLNNEPVLAGPPSAAYRMQKFIRRNRGQVIAGGLLSAALLLGATGTTVGLFQALEEKERADTRAAEASERADQVEKFAAFQSRQLATIDAIQLGTLIKTAMTEGLKEAGTEDVEQAVSTINFVDIALGVLADGVLEPSVEAAEQDFEDDPELHAKLLQAVSQTYIELGLYDRAIEPQQHALELRREHLGADHIDTLGSINWLGLLYHQLGRLSEAEPLFRESLEVSGIALGKDHADTLASYTSMGLLLEQLGRPGDAEEFFREAFEGFRRVNGENDRDTLVAMNNVGNNLINQGRLSEAKDLLEEVLSLRQGVMGEGHPDTLTAMNNLGAIALQMQNYPEAERFMRAGLEGRREQLGSLHPATLTSLNNLATVMNRQGKLAEAALLIKEAIDGRRQVLGDDHPRTLRSMGAYAGVLQNLGRHDEAIMIQREVLTAEQRLLGEDHPATLRSTVILGNSLTGQGAYEEAERYLRTGVDAQRRVFGVAHTDTLYGLGYLGKLLLKTERLEEAERVYRDRLAGCLEALGQEHPGTVSTQLSLASILTELGRGAEALPFSNTALETALRTKTPGDPAIGRALVTQGRALQSVNRWGDAITQLRKGYEILTTSPDSDQEELCEIVESILTCLQRLHNDEPNRGFDTETEMWRRTLTELGVEK